MVPSLLRTQSLPKVSAKGSEFAGGSSGNYSWQLFNLLHRLENEYVAILPSGRFYSITMWNIA
jgi:hypothetical protein